VCVAWFIAVTVIEPVHFHAATSSNVAADTADS
jgi:hypothetical protein